MRHLATPKTFALLGELRRLAAQVQPYLGFATPAACQEWEALQALWPSEEELRVGPTTLSDGDLECMVAKVRRFGEILRDR
jgi:hypothetical protein